MSLEIVNEDECLVAGLDVKKVSSLASRLKRISRELDELGVVMFGGSGTGSLRYDDGKGKGFLVVAEIGGHVFDGGDGATHTDGEGLIRGE